MMSSVEVLCEQVQGCELMKATGSVQTIGTVASDIIVKSKEGDLKNELFN